MSNFIRDNQKKLILISVILVSLIAIWKINIFQVWFYLTPQEILDSPSIQAVEIVNLKPTYDYSIGKLRTYVFIRTEDNEIYRCCSWYNTKDWVKQTNYNNEEILDKRICAEEIRKNWGLSGTYENSTRRLSMGWGCEDSVGDMYSSFQITQEGRIKGKTILETPFTYFFELIRLLCLRPISIIVCIWLIYQTLQQNKRKTNEQIS